MNNANLEQSVEWFMEKLEVGNTIECNEIELKINTEGELRCFHAGLFTALMLYEAQQEGVSINLG